MRLVDRLRLLKKYPLNVIFVYKKKVYYQRLPLLRLSRERLLLV